MSNIIDNPQNYGCTLVASIGEHFSWEFNDIVVLEHNGELYYAHDMGCSCPIPFEKYNSLADLTHINSPDSLRALEEEVNGLDTPKSEKMSFLEIVHSLMFKPNDILKAVVNDENSTNK